MRLKDALSARKGQGQLGAKKIAEEAYRKLANLQTEKLLELAFAGYARLNNQRPTAAQLASLVPAEAHCARCGHAAKNAGAHYGSAKCLEQMAAYYAVGAKDPLSGSAVDAAVADAKVRLRLRAVARSSLSW